jgi:DNA mismatch endonuclease (patch repair protein)
MLVRRTLHRLGFRYRLHVPDVPGKPDLYFPKYRAAVFVNGCFWHGHDCRLFRMPKTRTEFWETKIAQNRARDVRVRAEIEASGMRHRTIWECELKGRSPDQIGQVIDHCAEWLGVAGAGER